LRRLGFDLVLVTTLFALALRWRHWLGVTVAGAITADALLTCLQITLYDAPRVRGPDWLVVAIALAGPALAALVLWGAVGHRRVRPAL
jgi:hypothetical protein